MRALPPNAERYLVRMRSLEPPIELVDSIMAEVEATPQVRAGPDLHTIAGFALAAAAALLAIALLLRLGAPNVGPAPTPVPLDQLPAAGQVEARISIDGSDMPAAFGHGFLWLTNAATGELVRMDPANGSIASPMQITEAGPPVAITLTGSSIWVADRRDSSLVELDPLTLEERRRIPVSGTIRAIATDGADLWVLDDEAGELIRIDAADGSTSQRVPIAGSALLVHGGSVWVVDDLGAVVRIDRVSGVESGRAEPGFIPERLVPDGQSVLAVAAGEPVVRVDVGSMNVVSRGVAVMAVASQDGRVWAVLASGHLVRLAADTLQPVAASTLELDSSGTLAIGDGSLWATGIDSVGDAYLLEISPIE